MDIDLCDIVHAIENGNEEERKVFANAILKLPITHVSVDGRKSSMPLFTLLSETLRKAQE